MAAPTFTIEQLSRYFDRVQLSQKHRDGALRAVEEPIPLTAELLTALHVHQVAAIPYENLSLHYSKEKTVSLDPQDLYAKFVEKGRNRGGYCMENSIFFLHVLRSIGFDAYPTGVRIRLREDGVPKGAYIGLVHMVLIIVLPSADQSNSERYVCDVAFGGDGPTVPLPLNTTSITRNLGTQEVRYDYNHLPQVGPIGIREGSPRRKYWIYQYRNSVEQEWNSFYCFDPEAEFLEADFQIMNFFTSQGQTFQRTTVLIVKFVLESESESAGAGAGTQSRIGGKLMLVNGLVKRNMGGRTEIVEVCKTESGRIDALKRWFGITLTADEVEGIRGQVTELRDEIIAA